MKTLTLVLVALTLIAGPVRAQDRNTHGDPGVVIDALHEAARTADGETYFSLFTPDARFVGTDESEHWELDQFRAFAEPYFARGQGWDYQVVSRDISILPIACRCVAVFDEVLTNASYGRVRGSGVLRLTDEGWKIEQYVLSFTVPNDVAREVVGVIRAHEASQP